jgi:DNA-binding HxlR family transcriptional regulator
MGGRWKALIIDRLMKQPLRYSELKRSIPPASERVLTLQLKELEQDGLISKTIIVETSPKIVEYQLTEKGRSLSGVLTELFEWGKNNRHAVPIPG